MLSKIYEIFKKSTGISTDTRTVKKENLFFALSGANFNGNKFAKQAIDNGAVYSIIDDINYQNENTILVDDVLTTLQQLAKHHRQQLNIPIIALTGSNGKTTTKELLNAVLSQKYKTTATIGNLNNHIGVPLTLLSMNTDTEIGIVEMGANHPKEIETLCNIACPNFGYITNFGKAHLEGFGSLEGVIKAKSELYEYLRNHKQTAFINADDEKQLQQGKNIERVMFSKSNNFETQIELSSTSPTIQIKYQELHINSNLIGAYNFTNIAAAVTIGHFFKVQNNAIKNAIENYTPTNNRSQLIEKKGHQIILDAYNANPTSMMAALQNFENLPAKNKVVFLGDMFELGTESKKEHQAIVNYLSTLKDVKIHLLGAHFKNTKHPQNIAVYANFDAFKNNINLAPRSTILIKGSRGMALERVLDLITA